MRIILFFALIVASLECAASGEVPVYLCTKYDGTRLYINTGGLKGFKGCDLVDLAGVVGTLAATPWQWAKIADETDIFPAKYMHRASLVIAPSQRKSWILETSAHTMIDAATGAGANSAKSLYLFRCRDRTAALLEKISFVGQLGEGAIVSSSNVGRSVPQFSEVVPESLGEETLKFVCSYKK